MQPVQLSKGDSKVLAQVFDPESGPAKVEVLIDPYQPADRYTKDKRLLARLKATEKEAIRLIEAFEKSNSQTLQAKQEMYQEALSILNQIISENPSYASARNNRAQLRRWRFGDRNMLCRSRSRVSTDSERTTAGISTVNDLKQCIALASPERPQDAVSPSQARLLAQACTQLGASYHAASKDINDAKGSESSVKEFESWTKDQFEEEASRLFYLGGLYGNEVAKALAVHTNPHAKLCGSIVKEAMRKELAMQG